MTEARASSPASLSCLHPPSHHLAAFVVGVLCLLRIITDNTNNLKCHTDDKITQAVFFTKPPQFSVSGVADQILNTLSLFATCCRHKEWGNGMQGFKVSTPFAPKSNKQWQHVCSQDEPSLFIFFSVSPSFISCSLRLLLIIPSPFSARAAGFILGGTVNSF